MMNGRAGLASWGNISMFTYLRTTFLSASLTSYMLIVEQLICFERTSLRDCKFLCHFDVGVIYHVHEHA